MVFWFPVVSISVSLSDKTYLPVLVVSSQNETLFVIVVAVRECSFVHLADRPVLPFGLCP